MESAVETIVILDWEQSLGRREVFRMLYSGLLKSNELPINFDALLPRHSWPEEGTKFEDRPLYLSGLFMTA